MKQNILIIKSSKYAVLQHVLDIWNNKDLAPQKFTNHEEVEIRSKSTETGKLNFFEELHDHESHHGKPSFNWTSVIYPNKPIHLRDNEG